MRIAVIAGNHRRWSKYRWVGAALEKAGHAVRYFSPTDCATEAKWPDIEIWEPKWLQSFVSEISRLPSLEDNLRVGWMFDLIAAKRCAFCEQPLLFQDDGQRLSPTPLLRALQSCDVAFVKELSLLGHYAYNGVHAEWLDQACPSWLGACEHHANPKWDVLVLGTTRWRQRVTDVQELVKAGLRVAWAVPEGDHGSVAGVEYLPFTSPKDLPKLASQAAVLFDCGLRSDVDGYWSDKFWLALGMGACHVRRRSPGLPMPDSDQECYATYAHPAAGAELVASLVDDVNQRRRIGEAARRWVMAEHTYEHRVQELVQRCEAKMNDAASVAVPVA